jgi:DNA polymerase III subunit delta'
VSLLPWLEPLWRQTLAAQRAHALLLAGPAGAGQFELGLTLARSWLCESPAADGRACGHCASCTLVAAHTHPDLQVLVPEALAEELGWGDPAEGGTKAGKAKPSKDVKVEALRAAVEFAQQTSSRARAKVVLIHPAERMNAVSANTLLKTLEEPPGLARFVLCTGALDQLLPTIRSRCQLVALPTPARAESLAWLEAQGVDAAEVLLDAAGGVPLAALELHRQGLSAKAWQALPAALAAGQVGLCRAGRWRRWSMRSASAAKTVCALPRVAHHATSRRQPGRDCVLGLSRSWPGGRISSVSHVTPSTRGRRGWPPNLL